jgi:lipoyl(octanoyl) transferase
MTGFDRIVPCGLSDTSVTSMAVELGRNITIDEVAPVVEKYMYESLTKVAEFIAL